MLTGDVCHHHVRISWRGVFDDEVDHSGEVVLHELIADLNRLRAGAKRRSAAFQSGEEKERAATYDATVQAWDEAIRLATKKIDRCP